MEVEDLALELIFILYEQLEQLPILRQMVGFHAVGGVARVEGGEGAIVGLGSSVIGGLDNKLARGFVEFSPRVGPFLHGVDNIPQDLGQFEL